METGAVYQKNERTSPHRLVRWLESDSNLVTGTGVLQRFKNRVVDAVFHEEAICLIHQLPVVLVAIHRLLKGIEAGQAVEVSLPGECVDVAEAVREDLQTGVLEFPVEVVDHFLRPGCGFPSLTGYGSKRTLKTDHVFLLLTNVGFRPGQR